MITIYCFDTQNVFTEKREISKFAAIPLNCSMLPPPVTQVVEVAQWNGAAWNVLPERPPEPELPPSPPPVLIATKYKIRLALLNIGLLDDIESFMAVTEDKTVKIAWQYADEYRTDDPLVLGTGYALGKTEEEIRDVFELANSL